MERLSAFAEKHTHIKIRADDLLTKLAL